MNDTITRRPTKPRLRMLRDQQDQPLWVAIAGPMMCTGGTPSEAYISIARAVERVRQHALGKYKVAL